VELSARFIGLKKKRERKGDWDMLICICWLVDEGVKVRKKEFGVNDNAAKFRMVKS
jgi:hypothetical protein